MAESNGLTIKVFDDISKLSLSMAGEIARVIDETLKIQNSFSWVLSDGSTPKTLYRAIATRFRDEIQWEKVEFFLGG